ncbi:MAG TPA: MmgE/PrpD family protein, partial [Candidatus Dormibacteraeota bacterium]|nr:MmgE/PrpD family protein [Candidatus Dormibacteraeota bacterium]
VQAEVASYESTLREASVLGTGLRAPARFAAFANGDAIHADDYDDTQLASSPDRVYGLLTHPTAPVLPPVLAIAQRMKLDGAAVLAAYLVGVEVATKVCEAIDPRHYDAGFHSTGTAGTVGAGAAAARALGLSASQTAIALAISASEAAGLRENFGSMTKPFHAGHAADSGVLAAQLAQRGFSAAPNILEAKRGFFSAAGGGYDARAIDGRLGNPWTFEQPGISIKPHPSGSLTHPGMGAFLSLILEEDLKPDQVKRIVVGTNRHMPNALIHHDPHNELQAKFSMEFCLAILLLERKARLAQFTDEVVNRPDVKEMIRRVDFGVDPEAEAAGYNNMTTRIMVELNDGRKLTTSAAFGKGSPQNPMSDDELIDKFLDCLDWAGIDRAGGKELAHRVLNLEKVGSIDSLLEPLS